MRYAFDDYRLDTQRLELWRGDTPVKLQPKVFQVLTYLIEHRDRVVSKEELLEQLWPGQFIDDGSVNACLMAVRKAVGDSGQAQHAIQTLHGRGYRFVAMVEAYADQALSPPEPVVLPAAAATRSDGQTRVCTTCSHDNPASATLCNRCGAPLSGPTCSLPESQRETLPAFLPQETAPQPLASEAERRQLTVLCCDLVGAAHLAEQLDPETYREVVLAYHQVCAQVIERFDGSIAHYVDAGLVVYFGYPLAHEDAAQRAVHTGLGILAACATRLPGCERTTDSQLAVRIGIHTGLVVVGEVGDGSRPSPLAVGHTPHIAVGLQELATPNTVMVSASTHQLIQGYFRCESLGPHRLRGMHQPLVLYRVLHDAGTQSRLEATTPGALTPLVGRDAEVALFLERWTRVKEGLGQAVLLYGDPGMGKSRLVQVVKERIAAEGYTTLECRCSPYDQHSAWYPVTRLLPQILQWHGCDTAVTKLEKLEQFLRAAQVPLAETVPLCAALLALPLPDERYRPVLVSPEQRRQRTLDTLLAVFLGLAAQQPLLFIIEDLHWIDPSTLDLLSLVMDHGPTVAIYTLLTCRPTFQSPWGLRTHVTPMIVNRLSPTQAQTLVAHVAGGTSLPPGVLQQLVEHTDGVPLFIEEMTKAVLESAWLRAQEGRELGSAPVPALSIPATLQDALMARLDRLGTAKGVAQLGATIGREFSYALLQAIAAIEEGTLQHALTQLVQAEIVYQRGVVPQATYVFKHALIQEVASHSVLQQTRQQVHRRLVDVLERQFPEIGAMQPERLARHATEAGLALQAIRFWSRAGEYAFERGAYWEAVAHLRQGLAQVQTVPDGPARTHHELDLLIVLGSTLAVAHGAGTPEVKRVYARVEVLCQQVEEPSRLFPALRGLRYFYWCQGQVQTAHTVAERLLVLAQSQQDPTLVLESHLHMGLSLYSLGELVPALEHFEHGLASRDAALRHTLHTLPHPEVGCLLYSGVVLWYLGYPHQARTRIHEGLAVAQQLPHPHHLVWAQHIGALFYQLCREPRAAQALANSMVAAAAEQGIQGVETGLFVQGWALAQAGQGEAGIAQMRQSITMYRAVVGASGLPRWLALLAEAYVALGQVAAGLTVLAEAQALVDSMQAHFFAAEISRLTGEFLLRDGSTAQEGEAETCLRRALDIARRQQAKSLELRAAISLARLWHQQGKRVTARELLAPVYGWFTESFDTLDLQEAKALLEELGR
jgi:class 3 adenylate cyclase/DNA-binding winged helix-turn-helix (wHTH) protein/predicted ATPase